MLDKVLKERTAKYCDLQKVLESTLFPEKYNENQETCWLCWLRLTGQGLNEWRKEPYYTRKEHPNICPVCGYTRWIGGVWYPFRYIKENGKVLIFNPSWRRR